MGAPGGQTQSVSSESTVPSPGPGTWQVLRRLLNKIAVSCKTSLSTSCTHPSIETSEIFAEYLFYVQTSSRCCISGMNKTDATHPCSFTHALFCAYSAFSLFFPHSRSSLSFRTLLKFTSSRSPPLYLTSSIQELIHNTILP